jgi:hypothetical protein
MIVSIPRPRAAAASVLLLATGCVGYDAADIDWRVLTAEAPPPPPGPVSFHGAVAFALAHNPDLARLAAEARAAGADVPATDLQAQWDGVDERLALMTDPVALLQLGQRGAASDAAAAREAAALQDLAVARWRLVGQIAEVFAAHAALANVRAPEFALDPEPFVRAGLASPVAAAMARGAAASARTEALALEADRYGLLAELRTLLGLPPGAALTLAPVEATFPELPPSDEAALLRRPDLAQALARYRVADAEFRLAVAEQYPSLQLGPEIPFVAGGVDVMAVLRLPIGADARAHAAKERREAARARVVAALRGASNEADAALRHHGASEQRAVATAAMAAASASALAAAQAELLTDGEAFERVANAAQMAMREAMDRREAVVANARARVQHAMTWGWPAKDVMP